jgi:peptidase MA superfamily protein
VRALNSSFPLDPDDALLSYAESASIVTFIIERWGDDGLARLFASFRQEMSYDDAVESSLDVTIEQLDAEWKSWLGYEGDAEPDAPAEPGEDDGVDLSDPGVAATVGVALGLITCLALGGLVAFVLAYRARRDSQSSA